MIATLKADIKSLRTGLKGQDGIFYLGLFFIVLYYLRPQYIFSELLIIPWLQITLLVGLVMMVSKSQIEFKKEHFWLLTFACLTFLSAQTSLYPEISSKGLATPFIFFVEVLFLSNCVRNLNQLKILMIVFFLCVFKMSFFGARTWVSRGFGFTKWGISGPSGFFENSGEYTLLMAMIAVMSIPFILAMKPKIKIYWLLPVTAIMATIAASSRGGQLALLVGMVYLLLIYRRIKIKNILYIVLAGALIWTLFPEEQKARFQSAGDDKTSTTRLSYWSAGIEMAMENPLLGIGYRAFPEHYHQYYKVNDGSFLMRRREVSHNSLVEVASTIGLPALAIYLYFHFMILKRNRRSKERTEDNEFLRHFGISLNASVITYFVGAFFMSVTFYPYIYLLLSLSIIRNRLAVKKKIKSTPSLRKRNKPVTVDEKWR